MALLEVRADRVEVVLVARDLLQGVVRDLVRLCLALVLPDLLVLLLDLEEEPRRLAADAEDVAVLLALEALLLHPRDAGEDRYEERRGDPQGRAEDLEGVGRRELVLAELDSQGVGAEEPQRAADGDGA